jgi:hypothetical protein
MIKHAGSVTLDPAKVHHKNFYNRIFLLVFTSINQTDPSGSTWFEHNKKSENRICILTELL